jgi:hypothetical protein
MSQQNLSTMRTRIEPVKTNEPVDEYYGDYPPTDQFALCIITRNDTE